MSDQAPMRPVGRIELLISDWLRIGVVTSLGLIVCGSVLSFIHHPDYRWSPDQFRQLTHDGAGFPHDLTSVWAGVRQGRGSSIVLAGLILLIATPVLRVALCVGAFIVEKDGMFVLFTSVVLALLILSFLLGSVG